MQSAVQASSGLEGALKSDMYLISALLIKRKNLNKKLVSRLQMLQLRVTRTGFIGLSRAD